MTFHYTSVQSHSVMTPYGKRVKESLVKVENGKGVKMVSVADNEGVHSDTMLLSKNEMKNIQKHVFMPKLFHSVTKNVMRKKNSTTHRKHKKGTRKSKK
jgi:hypothetical protein